MGLDQYLAAEYYLSKYDKPEKRDEIKKILGFTYEQSNIEYCKVQFEVMYWRKANQIHKWFVENVQDGKDDCGTYYVARSDLEKLLALVNEVLSAERTPDEGKIAMAALPTQGGFFFGSTNYDEYYYDDLKETKVGLEKILNDKSLEDCSFYYSSSW